MIKFPKEGLTGSRFNGFIQNQGDGPGQRQPMPLLKKKKAPVDPFIKKKPKKP
jgi:hypothetical protein